MPVFNLYLKLLRKNIKTLTTYIIIFMILMLVFALNGASAQTQFQAVKGGFTIIDRDHGIIGKAIKKELTKKNTFVETKDNQKNIQDRLFYRQVQVILIIPKDFSKNFEAGKDVSVSSMQVENSIASTMIKQELNTYLKYVKIYQSQGYDFKTALDKASKNLDINSKVSLKSAGNKQETTFYFYFRYVPYILISIILCGMAPVICSLQKPVILKRNNGSAYPLKKINMELILGSLVFGLICILLVDGIGILFWGKQVTTSIILYTLVNSLLQMMVSMAIAYCLSMLIHAKDMNAINGAANIIGLASSFLGGIFIPIKFLNSQMQLVSHAIPAYWYTKVNELITKTTNLTVAQKQTIYQSYLVQFLFAVAILVLALVVSKKRYTSAG